MEQGQKAGLRLALIGVVVLAALVLLRHWAFGPVVVAPTATPTATRAATETGEPWATVTATASPAPSVTRTATRILPTATAVATPTPGGSAAIREVPPVVFALWDYANVDYQHLYPDWPPAGGMVSFRWSDLYQSWDVQDWSSIDRYILQARAYTVTLAGGTVIRKSVAFGVDASTMDDLGTLWFPEAVVRECGPQLAYEYDPDGEAGECPTYRIPDYSNLCWQRHFLHFIELLGERYDHNPAYDNLAFVKMNIGWDEEAVAWKLMGRNSGLVCDYTGGPTAGFERWAESVIAAYNRAFPHLVNVAQLLHHSTQTAGDMMAAFPAHSTGIKINGWAYDVEGARIFYGWQDPVLVSGVFGVGERWAGTLPIGFEPAGPWSGWQNSYWAWLNMLVAHPDLVDIQPALIQAAVQLEQEIGFPFMEWGLMHMGQTVETTPDVWIAFRETRQQAARWCAVATPPYAVDCTRWQDGQPVPNAGTFKAYDPIFGPFEYWLYEVRDAAYGSRTYRTADPGLVAAGLPEPARSHPYAANSLVRTDQAAGQRYVLLDIANAYAPSATHLPLASGGDTVWVITATLVNAGGDAFALEYFDRVGRLVTLAERKGPALGTVNQWVDVSWTLTGAHMANAFTGGGDFRLDCAMDGDEIVTRVIATHYHLTQPPALVGLATHYDPDEYAGRTTRSEELYDARAMACAVPAERWAELLGKCLLVLASSGRSAVVRVNDSGWLTEAGRFSWDVRRAGDLDVAQYWADPGGLPVVLDLPPEAFRQISPHMETVEVRAYAVGCAGQR